MLNMIEYNFAWEEIKMNLTLSGCEDMKAVRVYLKTCVPMESQRAGTVL